MAFRLVALEDHIKTKCFFCFCFTFIAFKICLLSIIRLFKFLSIFIHLFLKIVHRVQWAGPPLQEWACPKWGLETICSLWLASFLSEASSDESFLVLKYLEQFSFPKSVFNISGPWGRLLFVRKVIYQFLANRCT